MHLEFAHSLLVRYTFYHQKVVTVGKLSSFNCKKVSSKSFTKLWQCRKKWSVVSGLILREHNWFTQLVKLCFNLCSLRWLRLRRKHARSLISIGLWILYVELAWGRTIFSNEALNKENDAAPFIFSSSLIHSFMIFGKNDLLNVSVLQL